jgi:anti-sigma B factor antagonist
MADTCTDQCFDKHAVCVLKGELDLATVDRFRRAAIDTMNENGPALTLDVSGVTFMDCSSLSMIIALHREARVRGGHVTLAGTSPSVLRLLHLSKLDTVIATSEAASEVFAAEAQLA